MKKRIFIAIKTPSELEKSVELWQNRYNSRLSLESFQGLSLRWIKPKNLHITLIPPWYVDENQLIEVIKQVKLTAKDNVPFIIEFNRVLFGPPGRTPRLIWAESQTPEDFIALKNNLENSLFQSQNSGFYKKELRQLKLHLTIARFRPHEIAITKIPPLNEEVAWRMNVDSVVIMESELKKNGVEYTILEQIPLGS